MTRDREPLISLALYHLFKWSMVSPVLHTAFRGKIYGAEHVPQTGPLLVVSNHASYFDPPFLSNCMRRPVAYMAKEELFKVPVLATLIRWYGAYPIKRGRADRAAIRAAETASQEGWALGIFLEGTRTPDGLIDRPKLGAAMIAKKLQAPVLPVSLWGTEKILPKGTSVPQMTPITIRIGETVPPPSPKSDRAELEALTETWKNTINQMHQLGR